MKDRKILLQKFRNFGIFVYIFDIKSPKLNRKANLSADGNAYFKLQSKVKFDIEILGSLKIKQLNFAKKLERYQNKK